MNEKVVHFLCIRVRFVPCADMLDILVNNVPLIPPVLKERKRLVPMLKKAFAEYRETGKPPVRALVCDYTDDNETYNIDDEYIFCDKLIVAPLTKDSDTRKVYLPKGVWRDYWTKQNISAGWCEVTTDKIPVFEKIANENYQ